MAQSVKIDDEAENKLDNLCEEYGFQKKAIATQAVKHKVQQIRKKMED